jgi:hypothetical protein
LQVVGQEHRFFPRLLALRYPMLTFSTFDLQPGQKMSFLYDERVQAKGVLSRARYVDVITVCGAFGLIAAVIFAVPLGRLF